MGESELPACLCNIILFATASEKFRHVRQSFVQPGMHGVCLIHGIVGAIHYAKGILKVDAAPVFAVTLAAIKHLPLPCLMAELYRNSNKTVSMVHLASGVIPFILALTGKPDDNLTILVATLNIISLCYYAFDRNQEWGYYTAGFACLAYLTTKTPQTKIIFPLAMAGVDHCCAYMGSTEFSPPPRR